MASNVTPKAVIDKAGGVMALAAILGITHSAVCQWKNRKRLPARRLMELRFQQKPEWFNRDGSLKL